MARKLVVKRGRKVGAGPGALVHIGRRPDTEAVISVIDYDQATLQERQQADPKGCKAYRDGESVSWVKVVGVHQPELVEALGKEFDLHPLVVEDVLNTDQRPKIEDYDGYVYIVLRMLRYDPGQQQIHSEQLSLILGRNYVLSLQELPSDVFEGVRERLRTGRRVRSMHADYLAYCLIDAVVDHYFVLLENMGDQVEALEDELIMNPVPATLGRIHHFKREMLMLRKSVWPLREVLSRLSRDESPLISADTRLFLRDVYDHTVHVLDTIDTIRELLVGMLDLYLSSVSNRMNEVMKMLTIIATLFMPLTFIAGVYGMNFVFMPELHWRWAYPAVLVSMMLIAMGLVVFFRRRHWL
jgi:magnesium transporter